MAPASTAAEAEAGQYHVSRLDSVIVANGAKGVTFSNLEIRYARGVGVSITDSSEVVLDRCTVSDHGSIGVNITGGQSCGVTNSNIAGNGNVGVALMGVA